MFVRARLSCSRANGTPLTQYASRLTTSEKPETLKPKPSSGLYRIQ